MYAWKEKFHKVAASEATDGGANKREKKNGEKVECDENENVNCESKQ